MAGGDDLSGAFFFLPAQLVNLIGCDGVLLLGLCDPSFLWIAVIPHEEIDFELFIY